MRATAAFELAREVTVLELPAGDLFHRHRQVVLRARLDKRRRSLLEADALAELVVVVVDLASALRRDDDERVTGLDSFEQLVDAWMDHGRAMVPTPASSSSRSTIAERTAVARSRSSFR